MAKSSFVNPITFSTLISFSVGLFFPLELGFNFANLSVGNFNSSQSQIMIEEFPEIGSQIRESFSRVFQAWEAQEAEKKRQESSLIPDQFQGKIVEEIPLKNQSKIVALTFDDGPWPEYTNHILYVLDKYEIKATFFILGQNAQTYPGRLQQIALHGHALGNHSWSHPYRYQSPSQAAKQIDNTTKLIEKLTGLKTNIFRPPGGFLNNGLVSYAQQKKYGIIMWSADSLDYRSSKETILKNLLKETNSGGILLMHDGGGSRWHTLVALPYLIAELKNRGYQFVTVPELLAMGVNN